MVEMVVAISILSVVLAIFMWVIISVQAGMNRQTHRSRSNDQARLAVQELDREIRSSNVLYDPSLENDPAHGIYPGMALRIYTQSNGNTKGNRCVQWRIRNSALERREWTSTWRVDDQVSGWRVVADHVTNASASPNVAAFTLDNSQAAFGSRIVKVVIRANVDPSSGQTVQIDHSITGRDTEYGYPVSVCTDIPPYV